MSNGIFIISNGRAFEQKTYQLLKKVNIPIYIVIDDLDEQGDIYKEKYDNILVFNKKEYILKVDTMNNKEELRTPLYARMACQDFAKELGFSSYAILDDDFTGINYRYLEDGKLKSKKIDDIENLFYSIFNFLESTSIYGLCLANSSFYFGGAKNEKYEKRLYPGFYGFTFLKTCNSVHFKGVINEDINTTLLHNERGDLLLMLMDVCFNTCKRGSNAGGCKDLYDTNGDYIKAMYALINAPNRIIINKKLKENIKGMSNFPKILNERWKK